MFLRVWCKVSYLMEGKKVVLHSILLPPSFILLSCTLGTINMAKFAQEVGGEKNELCTKFFCSYFLIFLFLFPAFLYLTNPPGWNPVTAHDAVIACNYEYILIVYSSFGSSFCKENIIFLEIIIDLLGNLHRVLMFHKRVSVVLYLIVECRHFCSKSNYLIYIEGFHAHLIKARTRARKGWGRQNEVVKSN